MNKPNQGWFVPTPSLASLSTKSLQCIEIFFGLVSFKILAIARIHYLGVSLQHYIVEIPVDSDLQASYHSHEFSSIIYVVAQVTGVNA
jgi:hypothetical protein